MIVNLTAPKYDINHGCDLQVDGIEKCSLIDVVTSSSMICKRRLSKAHVHEIDPCRRAKCDGVWKNATMWEANE